jgi:RimJ/RimL family protein N-acetyltransferase
MIPQLATPQDFDFYYELRCDESNIQWTGHNSVPDKEGLRKWYLENINKEGRYFFLFFENGSFSDIIGYLYMDVVGEKNDTIDTGHGVHSRHSGKGYGTKIIKFALEYATDNLLFINYFQGWIASDNVGSIKNVLKNGYYKTDETKKVEFGNGEIKVFEKFLFDIIRN